MRPPLEHAYGEHRRQFAELWLPEGERRPGTVVIIHGGFWRARYTLGLGRPLAADLVRRGWTAWNLEYRTVGSDGGWPATFDDVARGIDALAALAAARPDLAIDTERVVAVGHSAGGHLAAWAAGREALPDGVPGARPVVPLRGAVAQAGVVALEQAAREQVGDGAVLALMGGAPDLLRDPYRVADPLAAVPAPVPVVCVHSRADANVPFSQSETYVAAARAAGGDARLHETTGDHFTLIEPSHADWQVVVDELPGLLGD